MSRYALILRLHVEERCSVDELAEWFQMGRRWVKEILRELGKVRA